MAHAKTAPLNLNEVGKTEKNKFQLEEEYLNMEFDLGKRYMFRLVKKLEQRGLPVVNKNSSKVVSSNDFTTFKNLVLTSQIIWKGQRANIRYYDGCDTIFVSEQPKEKETIEQLIAQTKKRNFVGGKLVVEGYDKMLLLYMQLCGWNADSPFRTSTANAIFYTEDVAKIASRESKKVDMIEEALELAKTAPKVKMLIHGAYLGISMVDYDTDNELEESQIRAQYRKRALSDAENFISSYGNKSLEVKYYIEQALSKGLISNKDNPNKVAWGKSGNVICDVSGLISPEAISNKLFEFSQLEEGAEFLIQLKAVFS